MSYYTPYEEDVYAKGFQHKSINDLPEKFTEIYNEEQIPLNILGHFWYADKTPGNFLEKAEKKYTNSLFAFTGDHFSRKFNNGAPTLYESSSVPFILYGKDIIPEKKDISGSHIDITPTLLNLINPQKTTYYSFGNSLFKTNYTL
jgi:phosphoglycerol transferase MdoB-like AlkP superfamily enzyme